MSALVLTPRLAIVSVVIIYQRASASKPLY